MAELQTSLPKTFDEAVDFILKLLGEKGIQEIHESLEKGDTPDHVVTMAHHGFGTYLRNTLKLWAEESGDLRQSIWDNATPEQRATYDEHWEKYSAGQPYRGRTMHADDASTVLLDAVVRRVIS